MTWHVHILVIIRMDAVQDLRGEPMELFRTGPDGKPASRILLSAELHERLVSIHPFIDGNGRTARLVMNLILLQQGFVIANLKGDVESRIKYYNSLEKAQLKNDKKDFLEIVATEEKNALLQYLKIIKGEK